MRRGVHDEPRVDHGVDLGGAHDPPDQRVLVRDADELGALELAGRVLGVDADDHVHRGIALERLGEPPTPVGGQPGDEYPAALGHRRHLSRRDSAEAFRGVDRMRRVPPGRTRSEGASGQRRRSAARSGTRWRRRASRAFPARRSGSRTSPTPAGAAERLARHPAWKKAKTIKANPDAPQTHSRRLALEEGKILVMAVPRLRDAHPFRLLDPSRLTKAKIREAATIKGALQARRGDRRGPGAEARPDPVRVGRGQPEGRADRQGRRASATSSTRCWPRREWCRRRRRS